MFKGRGATIELEQTIGAGNYITLGILTDFSVRLLRGFTSTTEKGSEGWEEGMTVSRQLRITGDGIYKAGASSGLVIQDWVDEVDNRSYRITTAGGDQFTCCLLVEEFADRAPAEDDESFNFVARSTGAITFARP